MIIQPGSTITLYSGVDIGTDMQLAFSTQAKQTAYFTSKIKKSYVNCTIVKDKIGSLKVAIKPVGQAGTGEITGVDLAESNYMSFVNPSFDNKVIYCYIVDYRYLNNETAEIMYMIDYWQTWMFDVTFQDMYIDREHLSASDWTKVEANPYRSDVPQMITAEPLPVSKSLEKPFYDIAWCDSSYSSKDGRALMSCDHPAEDITNHLYKSILSGSWKYWNVMLVQAPTDWTKYGYDASEAEGEVAGPDEWKPGDICYHGTDFYTCLTSTKGPFKSSAWTNITASVCNYDNSITNGIPVDTSVTSCNPGEYALAYNGRLYQCAANVGSAQTFNYAQLAQNDKFSEVSYAVYSNQDNPNKVEGQLYAILWFFRISYIWAGQDLFNDPFKNSGAEVALNNQAYTWTTKPHGCDVYRITDSVAWKELSTFYTKYNAVSQIIGIYGVPADMFDLGTIGTNGSILPLITDIGEDDTYPVANEFVKHPTIVRNKKLLTSPYSYIRIVAPNGQIKEYSYEKFQAIASSNDGSIYAGFRIVSDLSGESPKIYLIPYKYDTVAELGSAAVTEANTYSDLGTNMGTAWNKSMKYNMDEAICIEGFPEISFNTDGYLSFLASEYNGIRANTTMDTAIAMNQLDWETNEGRALIRGVTGATGKFVGSAMSGLEQGGAVGGALGAAGGFLGGAFDIVEGAATASKRRESYTNERAKYAEATRYVNGNLLSTDDPYIERYKFVKPAYANNKYYGGTGGVIRYMRGMGLFDFVAINVQLRTDIQEYYDKWFDLYGYASGRCGIPYVVQFCRGGSDLPHWVGNDGVLPNTTYVKTLDCKVEHAMMPVANAIKQMFDTGIRFKKGDLS